MRFMHTSSVGPKWYPEAVTTVGIGRIGEISDFRLHTF